jgi:DNA-binding MarR family transcriptional regulator
VNCTERPATEADLLADAERLADILMVVQRCFLVNLSQELARGDVSFPQFLLLGFLEHLGQLTMSGIAAKMQHTTAAATGMVDRLERLGYVERSLDHDDRRKVMVQITEKGSALVAGIRQEMIEKLVNVMGMLTEDEQKAWLHIYEKIHDYCQAK